MLHPVTVLILLCVGVFIIGWTYQTIADDYTVTAVVPAAPLEEGATITYPADGATLTTTPTTVSGTCPDASYVKLYDNGLFSGVAWCAANNTFVLETDLFSGTNTLLAEDFNVTDQQGPITPSISVDYQAPVNSSPSTSASSTAPASSSATNAATTNSVTANLATPPLLLTTDFHYQTYTTGSNFTWSITINGGTPPYVITVNWGDGQTTTTTYNTDPTFQIAHTYKKQGYYPIMVHASDASGGQRVLQLAALIKLPGAAGIVSGNAGNGSSSIPAAPAKQSGMQAFLSSTKGWLWLAWPSFIIVLLMMLSFWLGEREEYQAIIKRQQKRHLRRSPYHG